MAIAEITHWLNKPDRSYDAGVALYEQYSTNVLLKPFFKTAKSSYHSSRLVEEMINLNKLDLVPSKPPVFKIPELETISIPAKRYGLNDEQWGAAPDEIKDLYVMNSRLKSRADLLFHQTRIATTDDARLSLSLAQLADRSVINTNWKKIKDFYATGKLKEEITTANEKSIADMTMAELFPLSKNLPTYISKDKRNYNEAKSSSAREKIQKRLLENETKFDLVKKRLANG